MMTNEELTQMARDEGYHAIQEARSKPLPPMTSHDDTPRALPHAIEAEKSILSTMMSDEWETYIAKTLDEGVTPEWFYVPAHGTLFAALCEFHRSGRQPELIALAQHLEDRRQLDALGGKSELVSIYTASPSSGFFAHHLGLVRQKHLQRRGIAACTDAIGQLWSAEPQEVEALLAATSRNLEGISDLSSSDSDTMSAAEAMDALQAEMEAADRGETLETIPTPWEALNRILGGGISAGEITFVAARPSFGKTSFALNLLTHAVERGFPAHLVSIESGINRLSARLLAAESELGLGRINARDRDEMESQQLVEAANRLRNQPFWLTKLHSASAADVARKIRLLHRQYHTKLVLVDYLQLLRAEGAAERQNPRLRLDNALASLCPLADELGIALVILAQLNRDADGEVAVKLKASMVKETGQVEQDADVLILLGEAHDHAAWSDQYGARVANVRKNRDGPTAFARLQFHGPTLEFRSHH